MSAVERAAEVLWGIHDQAAACSHRPDHIRQLFIDANAAHRFAQALADAGLLVNDLDQAFISLAHSAEPLLKRHLGRDEDNRRADEWVARWWELHNAWLASRSS